MILASFLDLRQDGATITYCDCTQGYPQLQTLTIFRRPKSYVLSYTPCGCFSPDVHFKGSLKDSSLRLWEFRHKDGPIALFLK